MKNAVYGYIAVLALSGLVSLGLLGAYLLQEKDARGIAVLAIVVGGLLLAFIYAVTSDRAVFPAQRSTRGKPQELRTFSASSSQEYPHSCAVVWALIRPAETAMEFDSDVIQAVSVPGVPEAPNERQCFFKRNGQISVIEVLNEIPERLAVTQGILPPSEVSSGMIYRLEPTSIGCRLTVECRVEAPDYFWISEEAMREDGAAYMAQVGMLLNKRVTDTSPAWFAL